MRSALLILIFFVMPSVLAWPTPAKAAACCVKHRKKADASPRFERACCCEHAAAGCPCEIAPGAPTPASPRNAATHEFTERLLKFMTLPVGVLSFTDAERGVRQTPKRIAAPPPPPLETFAKLLC